MADTELLPSFSRDKPPSVIVLEAERGNSRKDVIDTWLDAARAKGALTFHVSGDFDRYGPWAGLRDLMPQIVPDIQRHAPELVVRHDYELAIVFARIRNEIAVRNMTLTDMAVGDERVRNFPSDRAFRIVHGIIDLLDAWREAERDSDKPWVIACDCFDEAGILVRTFYRELARRRQEKLRCTLLLTVGIGQGDAIAAQFESSTAAVSRVRLALAADPPTELSPLEAERLAEALETRMGVDLVEIEYHLPQLIRYWRQSGRKDKLLKACALAHGIANHFGIYEDALRYGREMREHVDLLLDAEPRQWVMANTLLLNSYIAARDPQSALQVADKMLARVVDHEARAKLCYFVAMLHARYLPERDPEKAEAYLQLGLDELAQADIPERDRHFLFVFNRNGLAFVRHRQGRAAEAIQLCKDGVLLLDQHLRPDQHRLHRSVLVYNIAQVYGALGAYPEAIAQFSSVIEMDPNYSEYHNERGAVFMKVGALDRALDDFRKAILLSPPYAEVHVNMAQCLRMMGRMEEAVRAYSLALDLDPKMVLACVGRAQAYEELGRAREAMDDYSAALAQDPVQPTVLANRAVLLYGEGRVEESRLDLDQAIRLAPRVSSLYQNRAIALLDLGRADEAIRDLRSYLQMDPEAEDRAEVIAKLRELEQAA